MLSQSDQQAVTIALHEAEQKTSAKIGVITAPISHPYHDFVLFYGIVLGSLVSLGLWLSSITVNYIALLAIQFGIAFLIDMVPGLRMICVMLIPRRVRDARAAHRAHREYHHMMTHVPSGTPAVLLFASLAERYVHVLTSPSVHKEIPDNWDAVTKRFAASIKTKGLRDTSVEAIHHIADILSSRFPGKNNSAS